MGGVEFEIDDVSGSTDLSSYCLNNTHQGFALLEFLLERVSAFFDFSFDKFLLLVDQFLQQCSLSFEAVEILDVVRDSQLPGEILGILGNRDQSKVGWRVSPAFRI